MPTIVDYVKRKNQSGEEFFSLVVESGLQIVKSKSTERFYATSGKRASIPTTLDEQACQRLIGEEIPGIVKRISCEPYEHVSRKTGEVLTLEHRWVFMPEDGKEEVKEPQEIPVPEPEI